MNETNNKDPIIIKSEIVEIATKMLENKIDLIEGCRKLVTLHYGLDAPNDAFLVLRGIESESQTFPIGKVRDTCASEALLNLDQEKHQFLTYYKDDILDACREIQLAYTASK